MTARPMRRDLLGAVSFTALAGIAAVTIARPDMQNPTSPTLQANDAELIAIGRPDASLLDLSDQFMALQVEIDAVNARLIDTTDEDMDTVVSRQSRIMDEMDRLTATTLAGHRARAATLEKWYSRGREGEFDSVVEWDRIGPLFRDLLGVPL